MQESQDSNPSLTSELFLVPQDPGWSWGPACTPHLYHLYHWPGLLAPPPPCGTWVLRRELEWKVEKGAHEMPVDLRPAVTGSALPRCQPGAAAWADAHGDRRTPVRWSLRAAASMLLASVLKIARTSNTDSPGKQTVPRPSAQAGQHSG